MSRFRALCRSIRVSARTRASVSVTRNARAALGVLVVLSASFAAGACRGAPARPRDRVLAGLPGDVVAVAIADGRALAHPRIRSVLDALAARWPTSLGCLVDAAVASDAVGVTIDRASNVTAVVALARDPHCPALSQRAPGLWIATLGAGPSAATTAVRDDPRFARAREYLVGSPIAAVALGEVHLIAAAQPEPLDAWLAIDAASDGDAVAGTIESYLGRMQRDPATAALAARLRTSRPGPSQLVIRLTGPLDTDLGPAVRTLLAWSEPATEAPPAVGFACPSPSPGVSCADGRTYRVSSLPGELAPIVTVGHPTPIVINGSVTGLRLDAAVQDLGLRVGDVVVAMAGRLVTSRMMLADWIAHARVATTVTIRRGTSETVLDFAER